MTLAETASLPYDEANLIKKRIHDVTVVRQAEAVAVRQEPDPRAGAYPTQSVGSNELSMVGPCRTRLSQLLKPQPDHHDL